MHKVKEFTFLILLLITFSDLALCQTKSSNPFNLKISREVALLGAGAVAAVTAFAILDNINPLTREEIELLDEASLSGFDRGAIGPYTEDNLGDALLYASYAIPLSFVFFEDTRSDIWDLTLMYGEVLLLQSSINGIVKGATQRTRPFVYDDQTSIDNKLTKDARVSFFPVILQ